jgi:heme/copper-type cytochrome/quinol oxidase subunit 2
MNEETMQTTEPKKSNTMMIVLGVVLLGIVGFLLFRNMANSDQADTNQAAEEEQTNAPTATTPVGNTTQPAGTTASPATGVMVDPSGVQVIKMEAGSFYFTPNTITVRKGQKVRIELTSKDMMHDFNIQELGVKSPITKAGDTSIVEFVANQVGEFEYYCSVGQHRQNGQVGTLIVEE